MLCVAGGDVGSDAAELWGGGLRQIVLEGTKGVDRSSRGNKASFFFFFFF